MPFESTSWHTRSDSFQIEQDQDLKIYPHLLSWISKLFCSTQLLWNVAVFFWKNCQGSSRWVQTDGWESVPFCSNFGRTFFVYFIKCNCKSILDLIKIGMNFQYNFIAFNSLVLFWHFRQCFTKTTTNSCLVLVIPLCCLSIVINCFLKFVCWSQYLCDMKQGN